MTLGIIISALNDSITIAFVENVRHLCFNVYFFDREYLQQSSTRVQDKKAYLFSGRTVLQDYNPCTSPNFKVDFFFC